jgi:HSP20 family molecular chaperone IbpA
MDRVFAQALGGTGGGMMSANEGGGAGGGLASWSPAIEVKQKGNDLVVCAELPGLKPEEVRVEVNEDALVIEGERARSSRTTREVCIAPNDTMAASTGRSRYPKARVLIRPKRSFATAFSK